MMVYGRGNGRPRGTLSLEIVAAAISGPADAVNTAAAEAAEVAAAAGAKVTQVVHRRLYSHHQHHRQLPRLTQVRVRLL